MDSRRDKLARLAARLNNERGRAGIGYLYKAGKIVGFHPCEKAIVALAALGGYAPIYSQPPYNRVNPESVLMEVYQLVSVTPCECHSELDLDGVLDYAHDKQ